VAFSDIFILPLIRHDIDIDNAIKSRHRRKIRTEPAL